MQGPGRWAPRASGGLRVKRLVGQAPQVGDPRRACQRGGLPCVTPSPQGDPFAWGTCESGGSPPDPPSSAHGETWGWGTAAPRVLPEPRFPSRDSSCSALSPISGRGVFWGRPPWSWPLFLVPSCVGWGSGRPRKACLPCLPPVQHVSTLQPPGCPAVTGRAALAQVRPGRWGVRTPGVRPSPGPPSAPEGRGGGSCPQPAPSQSIWEGHLQIDSLSRPGWSRAAVAELAEAGGLRCRGSRLWVDVSALEPPGWAERVGGRSRDAQPAPAATSILPRPVPAQPSRNPRLQGWVGGSVPPLCWLEPSVRFPHPVGLRQAQARWVRSGLPQGPATERDASPSLTRPGRSEASLPQLPPRGPRLSPCVWVRPRTGSHHVPPWSWPLKSHPTPAICLGKPAAHLPPGLKRWSPAVPATPWCRVRG